MTIYESIKGFHVVAVLVWMAGTFGVSLVIARMGKTASQAQRTRVRAFFIRVVTPAMLIALFLGVWLMVTGGWFPAGWMQLKLVAVICLTAAHGVLSGALRRYATESAMYDVPQLRATVLITLILLCVIVALVLSKTTPW